MENRKDIGKALKDKLENLDKSPSDALWNSIEKDLDKKKKRRIFFWLFPTLLIIGLTTSALFFNKKENIGPAGIESKIKPSNSNEINVVNNDAQNNLSPEINKENPENKSTNRSNKTTSIEINKKKKIDSIDEKKNYKTSLNSNNKEPQEPKLDKTKSNKNNSNSNQQKTRKTETKQLVSETKKTVIYNNNYEEYEVVKKYKIVVKKTTTSDYKSKKNKKLNTKVSSKKSRNKKNTHKDNTNKTIISKTKSLKEDTSTFFDTVSKKQTITSNKELLNNEISNFNKTDTINTKKSTVQKTEKKLNQKKEYKKDSLKVAPENEFEYFATAFYGPTLFGSLTDKSMINEYLNDVKKIHPISDHYGFYLKTKYKRFGFSGGISRINLVMNSKLNSNNLISNYSNIDLNSDYNPLNIKNIFQSNNNVKLEQELSYYEIPIELYFTLNNPENLFTIDLFTGVSMMYLHKNKLSISSNETKKTNIGSIENIIKMNISYDLGLSLNYKLNNHYYINFNPIFKQYITTFNEKNNSKPYSLSIQSGLTYKF